MRGVLHLHTVYSDGEFTLPALKDICRSANCAFACVTDHAESFDQEKLQKYIEECQALSDAKFCFIAGLEFECEQRMHVLGYGVAALAGTQDPQQVIHHIAKHGGISVIAHPKDAFFPWIEKFSQLPDGIEAWNTKYDGRYAPRPSTFALISRLQLRKPELRAFYGQDLHWRKQFRGLYVDAACATPEPKPVLAALAAGRFHGVVGGVELPASGSLAARALRRFERVHWRSEQFRRLAKGLKDLAARCGFGIPASIKTQLRRFF